MPTTDTTVPAALRARAQWVAWKYEERPGAKKPTKVPYRAPHTRADTTDPSTWLAFDAAQALAASDGFAGVGFVFAPDDDFVGVDLDGAFDEDGALASWARDILDRFAGAAYVERSPSKTGLHLIGRGRLPAGARKTARVELYDRGRYFTVTGDVFEDRTALGDVTEPVAWLDAALPRPTALTDPTTVAPRLTVATDDEVRAAILASRDAKSFHRLYVAGETRPGRSASEDDYELAAMLARHVGGDRDRIERLLKASALGQRDRRKWERRDYLDRTINAALRIAGAERPTMRERFHLLTEADLFRRPDPAWLIESVLPAGGLSVLYGPPGAGKSFLALDWALSVAADLPWTDRRVRAGPAAYVSAEGNAALKCRVASWKAAHRCDAPLPARFVLEPVNLLDPTEAAALATELTVERPAIVVLDTLARCLGAGDENKQQDMNALIAAVDRLRLTLGAHVLLVHHARRADGQERGSSVLRGAADTMFALKNADGALTLRCEKQKDAEPAPDRFLKLTPQDASCVVDPDPDRTPSLDDAIEDYVQAHPGCSSRTIERDVAGRNERKRESLARLEKDGRLVRHGARAGWHVVAPI